MIGIFDVGFSDDKALVGCLSIAAFEDDSPTREWIIEVPSVGPYEPGQFWKRELDPLVSAISSSNEWSVCVIDAFVDLGAKRSAGLGRILYETTGIPVIGVAKSRYPDTPKEYEILRGSSKRPLFVSTAGVDLHEAKGCIARMAGDGRLPTMIRRADQLSRGAEPLQ